MEIKEFYFKHHGVDQKSLLNIEWTGIKKAFNGQHALSYKKTFHNLRNTMTINKKWEWSQSDLCPLCQSQPETIPHMIQCTHPDMQYVRATSIETFRKTMKTLGTNPLIQQHWMSQLNKIINSQPTDNPSINIDPASWNIMQAHQQQSQIGWYSFLRGLIGKNGRKYK